MFRLSSLRQVCQKKRHLDRTHWVLPPFQQSAREHQAAGEEKQRDPAHTPPALSLYLIKYWSGS